MKKQAVLAKLETSKNGLKCPEYSPEFARFYSDLKDVVYSNIEGASEVEWDEHEKKFFFLWVYSPAYFELGYNIEVKKNFNINLEYPIDAQLNNIIHSISAIQDQVRKMLPVKQVVPDPTKFRL